MLENQTLRRPVVSIVTVTYNAESTIGVTMKSVADQTASDYEHIIMDGASVDGTLDIVGRDGTPRTRVFSSRDQGIYDAMNKALGVAEGRYVLFLNAGDRFAAKDSLQRYIDAINSNDSPDIVYGQTVLTDLDGNVLGARHLEAPQKLDSDSFRQGMVVCHQAFMAKKDIAPLYDLNYRFSADYEWCLRCLQNSKNNVYLGDDPVIHYLSEGMTTANHKASLKERFRIMCRYYGTVPTVFRHIGFAFRHLKRRK